MRKTESTGQQGFSLIEVMFALFLIVLVIGISSQVAGNSVRNASSMKESTFARWVGLNQLELYQMALDSGTASAGNDQGDEDMGGVRWRWVREVNPSSSDILHEVKVSVFLAEGDISAEPVISVKGYIRAP